LGVNGIIGKKIGTTQVFRDNGNADCVTAIRVDDCVVTQIKTVKEDGYDGIQLGYETTKRLNKPMQGHLKPSGAQVRYLREVTADGIEEIEVGQHIGVSVFQAGDRVDATGWSKGRGFAGGVKRHHFHGGPKTHGQSDRHRAPGSIGAGSSPGRVLKGLKMAGHMGDARVTVRNLEVVEADPERNLLFVKGAIPGAGNSLVLIFKSSGAKR
jgi:large subunit ribosomal protein L3